MKLCNDRTFVDLHAIISNAYVCMYCMYVCMHVCNTINFERPDGGRSFFTHPLYLEGTPVKFVYEGHRIRVEVPGAKMV